LRRVAAWRGWIVREGEPEMTTFSSSFVQGAGLSRRELLAAGLGLAGIAHLPLQAAGKSERLKITKVEVFKVVVPMQEDIINSAEFSPDGLTEFPTMPKLILKVHTDSGIVGIGETGRGTPEAPVRKSADAIVGKNIFDFNLTRLELAGGAGYNAFESAFYDAAGKALGWPVCKLLGGMAQPKVLVNYWCGRKNAADMRRVAERAVKGGFDGIKIKGRKGDPFVQAAEAAASVSPALKLTVDFNASFKTLKEFLPFGKQLDAIGNVRVIEDPFTKEDLAGYRELGKQLKTPVALHLNTAKPIIAAIKAQACSVINTYASPNMAGFVFNAYIAGAAGIPVWHASSHDLGIMDANFLHTCAAAPNCTFPSDILSHQRVDDLIVKPIEIRDSHATVTTTPGLGIELDEEAVRKFTVA